MPAALKSISKQALAMANARSRTSFDVEKLTNLIYGGASVVRARRAAWARVEKALGTDDTSRLPGHYAKTSREDLYLDGLRMGRAVWEDRRTHNHAHFDWLTPRYTLFNYSPFGLSPAMFVKMLQLMATPAQQARWLTPALAGRINGADPKDEKTQLLIFQHRAQREFITAVEKVEDEEVKGVLERLRSVFALSTIVNPQSADALTFVEDGFLSEEQLDEIRHTLRRLLDELLPDAIGLTDAWDFTDAGLGSAIGRKDGEAYETLMSWTRQLPINKMVMRNGGVHLEAWKKYIRPALKGVEEDKKESGGSGIEFTPYEREHQVMMAGKASEVL
ncbi:Peroxisomal acyl-coenzyme A oxidase 1 [Colletotrichum sp. SAR 10_98]|nr:Peroxisomal acyl-coenzyme A oxidase 1 [Colletotrichum sp. SAR 10_98]